MMSDDDELIAAALLHDTMEDAGVSYEELKKHFGDHVADLVAEESEDKSKTWMERKSRTIEHLRSAGREIKILTLADKLSNIRDTARDYLLEGENIWERFNVKEKDKHAWYYNSMVDLLEGAGRLSGISGVCETLQDGIRRRAWRTVVRHTAEQALAQGLNLYGQNRK